MNIVVANNAIRLCEIRAAVIADQGMFRNINNMSVTTTDRILRRSHIAMKQLYTVLFQRNSDVVYAVMPCHVMQSQSTGVTFHCHFFT